MLKFWVRGIISEHCADWIPDVRMFFLQAFGLEFQLQSINNECIEGNKNRKKRVCYGIIWQQLKRILSGSDLSLDFMLLLT